MATANGEAYASVFFNDSDEFRYVGLVKWIGGNILNDLILELKENNLLKINFKGVIGILVNLFLCKTKRFLLLDSFGNCSESHNPQSLIISSIASLFNSTVFGPFSHIKLFSILVLIIPPGVLVASKTKKSLVFLAKKCAGKNIVEAINAVYSGKQYFSESIKDKLLSTFRSNHFSIDEISQDGTFFSPLTPRETDVLKLICKQYNSNEISKTLHISTNTVETHRKNLINKLKVKNVVGLAIYAVKNNIV